MDHAIIPYIPFSCALVWRHLKGFDEPEIVIDYGFTPRWFRKRIDIDFGKRWHRDPVYRRQAFVEMAELLNREFPELHFGGDPKKIKGSISGIQSCALIASFFGQGIDYSPEGWPVNRGRILSDEETDELEVPNYRSHPEYENLMRQMEQIECEWGTIEGELNFQSVMNTAFRLRSNRLFLDMYDRPERVHHLFKIIYQTMVPFIDEVHQRQSNSGVERDFFVTSNCVVNMISREHYEAFLMPWDIKLRDHFPFFGIHNCNWNVDAYIESYAKLGEILYLDFGMDSDLQLLRELFPAATRVSFYRLTNGMQLEEIKRDLEAIHRSDSCTRIYLSAIEAETHSTLITGFYNLASDIWKIPIQELLPDPPNY